MGCAAAKAANPEAAAAVQPTSQKPAQPPQPPPPRAVAFEVHLGDAPVNATATPPERFQRRTTDSPTVTAEAIRQKQAKAEQRRQEVLEGRVRTSKMFAEKACAPPVRPSEA
ncbi:uncharacterized protein LOC144154762 [Haemaphysalis longicornis]